MQRPPVVARELKNDDLARPTARVLVVEDEADIREVIAFTLEMDGREVVTAADGLQALDIAATDPPDVVVLDLMLPGVHGLEVLRELRMRHPEVAIVVLSALASNESKIRLLRGGADDYLTKPFDPEELAARIETVLRRCRPQSSRVLESGRVRIDKDSREVTVDGKRVDLTAKEFDLLAFLASTPGRVFTRHQLLVAVWHSSSEYQQEATVSEHVHRLRAKLGHDATNPPYIETVRGVGYRYERRQPGTIWDGRERRLPEPHELT